MSILHPSRGPRFLTLPQLRHGDEVAQPRLAATAGLPPYRCASIGTDLFTVRSPTVHIEQLLSVALAATPTTRKE